MPRHSVGMASPEDTINGVSFPPEVEDEVNRFFDRIFNREISIPDVIDILKRLRVSSNPTDQHIFACLINNIFDEYRFFPKYPDNELLLTATLFGQIIQCQLISFVPLGAALRGVLDALKKPSSNKMFRFGLQALIQFQQRLVEWPQYCSHLLQINTLQQFHPELYSYIRCCIQSVSTSALSPQVPNSAFESMNSVQEQIVANNESLSILNVSSLIEAAEKQNIITPNESVRDRILFIINNLSSANVESKANDLVKVLQEPYYPWLAQYLVIKRASMESNFHKLYLDFLDILKIHPLENEVLRQTYSSIYVLLRSNKIVLSSSERSLLKNLGLWLGGLTIARNRPILYRDLSLKDLLIDGYVTGKLIVVIPFVCKTLEQSIHSKVFKPNNPWLMAITRVLVELYLGADLKLNLKFEVEVLCKHLLLDLKEVRPSSVISRLNRLTSQTVNFSASRILSPSTASPEYATDEFNLESCVVINPRVVAMPYGYVFKKIIAASVELAIREILESISERTSSISVATVQVLASIDFTPDQKDTFLTAVEHALEYLSTNLAHVTSMDPLRARIISHAKSFVASANLASYVSDNLIQSAAEDNIELATAFVEKSSIEKAKYGLEALLLSGNLHGERLGLLSAEIQASVYRDFNIGAKRPLFTSLPNIIVQQPLSDLDIERFSSAICSFAASHANGVKQLSTISNAAPDKSQELDAFFHSVCVRFVESVNSIEKLVFSCNVDSVSLLSTNHEIRNLMKQIVLLASSSPIHRDELCLLMSQRLMQGLYKTRSLLYIDIIIMLLLKIFEYSAKAAKEVTAWIIYSTDERKYSILATAALFGSGVIYVLDFDGQLAKQIESEKESAVEFAVDLIRKCVFDEPSIAAPYDFVYSLEALSKILQISPHGTKISSLLDDISSKVKAPQSEPQLLKQNITFCFTDWFRLCQYPSISEKLISTFVDQLFERNFLSSAESSRLFFQTCTEAAIELYARQRRAPAIFSYRSIDAYARLIAQILFRNLSKAESEETSSIHLFEMVLVLAGFILVQGLEQDIDYLQKPFSRLFISIMCELNKLEDSVSKWTFVEAFCAFLQTISPCSLPSFSLGWLEILTNSNVMPALLLFQGLKGWSILALLLGEFLKFSSTWFLNPKNDASDGAQILCRGLTKVFLIISHDCPDFLASYHAYFCQFLPFGPIQLKNIVLAAVPSGISTPDPLSADLKVDLLPDIQKMPNVMFDTSCLNRWIEKEDTNLKSVIDGMLNGGHTASSVVQILKRIISELGRSGETYQLLYSVVTHVCLSGMTYLKANEAPGIVLSSSVTMEFVLRLLSEGSNELRYFVLGIIADNLRFPNRHTHYFSCFMLYLFAQGGVSNLREQLARVLLERLIVHRPHPWGVMITFIELLKNPQYRFWENKFTRATPDIERIFESIAQSCLLPSDNDRRGAAS